METTVSPEAPRRRGRPSNAAKAAQDAAQQPQRAGRIAGRVSVQGRDGRVLSRKRTSNTDPYAIPKHMIPDGWDYQWNTYTVVGQQAVDSQILMAENGWTPVPASRHPEFMPEGYKGQEILRGGMRLEERPIELTYEAKQEEYAKAVGQMKDQNSQFDRNFGKGFENRTFAGRSRAPGEGVRTGLDVAADIPRPRLEIDPNN